MGFTVAVWQELLFLQPNVTGSISSSDSLISICDSLENIDGYILPSKNSPTSHQFRSEEFLRKKYHK